jgi:ribosomal protein L34E
MMANGNTTFLVGLTLALAAGWVVLPRAFYRTVPQPLEFSHKLHTSETVGLNCEDCHSFTTEGRFSGIPQTSRCAECHSEPLGTSETEKKLVEEYVRPGQEIPWLVYSRQPDNVYFPHIQHVKNAGLECATCHGPHGASERLRPYRVDRVSGYSRDLSGRSLPGFHQEPAWGLRMDDCCRCHAEKGGAKSCLACHK